MLVQITPDEDQSKAIKAVVNWHKTDPKSRSQVFRLFGYAGTGKTELSKIIAAEIGGRVGFAAFTGKAALVMNKKGCSGASTLHSLVYNTRQHSDGSYTFHWNHESILRDLDLLIVDEVSMVDEDMRSDILAFGIPVLVLGDPGQLPPVKGTGAFINDTPDVMLTRVHRQAAENPIIWMATKVRKGYRLKIGQYGSSLVTSKLKSTELLEYDQTIVGTHKTRHMINTRVRRMKGFESDLPTETDRLLCLRNDRDLGIFNGGMFEVLGIRAQTSKMTENSNPAYINMKLQSLDNPEQAAFFARSHTYNFLGDSAPDWRLLKGTQEFDFGYGITCHKSQGSQWVSTLIFDESHVFGEDWNKWLYTALTRAEEKTLVYV